MANKRVEQEDINKYWEIFSTHTGGGKHLDGHQAASVLKISGLRDDQLERVWDLSDVDKDGRLDFEEFCVAMRLATDIVNGEMADVPTTLPDWLVPETKVFLVQASRALSGEQPQYDQVDDYDDDTPGLKDGFDWYMSKDDRSRYEDIYTANRDPRTGSIHFDTLTPLYDSLDVPDTDIRSAWNLVNPRSDAAIGKDACLAFLHILNNRHEGFRIPRSVPPSLRASFEQAKIEYQLDKVQTAADRWGTKRDDSTLSGRKAKFGDAYLSRLGVGDRAASRPKGTDFSTTRTDGEWEEVRLKKQLKELEEKMAKVEEAAQRRRNKGGKRDDSSKPALVKRELQQLLEWKRRELRDLETGEGRAKEGESLKGIADEIAMVKEQVDGLEAHLRKREEVLTDLRRQIEDEKAAR